MQVAIQSVTGTESFKLQNTKQTEEIYYSSFVTCTKQCLHMQNEAAGQLYCIFIWQWQLSKPF